MYLDNSLFKQIEKTDEPDRSIGLPIAESTVVYDDRSPVLQRSVSYSEKKNRKSDKRKEKNKKNKKEKKKKGKKKINKKKESKVK